MRALRIILMALAFVAFHAHAAQRNLTVTASNAQEQKRIALVIGNAAYQSTSPLRNPVNDAHAMADALNKLGFQVIEVTDASQKEMNRAIAEFGSKLNAETAALFFYAGHGLQVKNKNYLVPVDAQINGEAAVRAETVDVDTVMDQLNVSSLSIVILDACRNNPFERSFRKMGGGLAQMDAPKGSFVAYATAPGKTAADGDGKNGLFTQELLKQINTPGLSLEGVFKRVRANVSKTTGDTQMPWDSSSMTGDFYFKPGDGTSVASLVPVPAQPARIKTKEEIEDGTWNTAEAADTAEAINAYLSGYPKGRYVAQAKVKLATLKKQAQQPAPAPVATTGREDNETALWTEAQKGNSKEDYDAYLSQYPKGKYVALAKSRIKKLQDEAAAEAVRKEQEAWEAAGKSESEDGYQSYIKGYPQGNYAGLAQVRLRKLQTDQAVARQKKLEEEAVQQAKQEREAAARQESERQRQQAEATEAKQKQEAERQRQQAGAAKAASATASVQGRYGALLPFLSPVPPPATYGVSQPQQGAERAEETQKGYVSQGGLTWMPVTFAKPWADANSYCANTTIRGQSGWRLPTKDELIALYNSGAMDGQGWTLLGTWSSTPVSSGVYYNVYLGNGGTFPSIDTYGSYVTCVR